MIESKPDHFLDDLRLNNPWPELKQFAETIDFNTTDPVVHKHIPYVLILVKVAEEWTKIQVVAYHQLGKKKTSSRIF